MKSYKIAKGWAIFIYICAPLIIALFCGILLMPFLQSDADGSIPDYYWFMLPLSIGMIAFMIIALLDTAKGRFVIDKDRIYTIGALSNRQLMLDEIAGYRITENYLIVVPKFKDKKKIQVSKYIGEIEEIIDWMADHYPDLDLEELNDEKEEIFSSDAMAWTADQREHKLMRAQKTANALNWLGGFIGTWAFFVPQPYEMAITAAIVFPFICIIILKYFKGLITIDQRYQTPLPAIVIALLGPGLGLLVRALQDYNIADYSNLWLPVVLVPAVYLALFLIGNKTFNLSKPWAKVNILVFAIMMLLHGLGTVIVLNCLLDQSPPEVYHATILKKRISSGKTTTYYFALSPWGKQKEGEDVSVSKAMYGRLDSNDRVNVYYMSGKFNIPWYELTE